MATRRDKSPAHCATFPLADTFPKAFLHTAFATVCGKQGLRAGDRAAEDVAVGIVDLATTGVTSAALAQFHPLAKRHAGT